jgi:hypothetical protein
MQQNPYWSYCWNSLVISEQDEGKYIGICNKCSFIVPLSTKQTEDYQHNQKCKTLCECGGTAYVHNNDPFYHCFCCFKKIPLAAVTTEYLENAKKPKDPKVPTKVQVKAQVPELLVFANDRSGRIIYIQEPEEEDHLYVGRM